jgi:O-6-methylguanine DNA methyltransferase
MSMSKPTPPAATSSATIASTSSSARGRFAAAISCRLTRLATPIGEAIVIEDAQERLRVLDWADYPERWQWMLRRHVGPNTSLREAADSRSAQALRNYLAGALTALEEVQTASSGTDFQQTVWTALRAIPAGQTRSYAELARAIGQPGAVRAVAAANGANPIGVVVPCHRVIGSNGALTGYAGGLQRKAWLLRHEGGP